MTIETSADESDVDCGKSSQRGAVTMSRLAGFERRGWELAEEDRAHAPQCGGSRSSSCYLYPSTNMD